MFQAACTNWKRLWMILTGLTEVEDPMEIHSGIPHQVHNKMRLVTQKLTVSVSAWCFDVLSSFVIPFLLYSVSK